TEGTGPTWDNTERISPHHPFRALYEFKFPLKPHSAFYPPFASTSTWKAQTEAPSGKRNVKLQIGWGQGMDIDDFMKGEYAKLPQTQTGSSYEAQIPMQNALLREKWQHLIVLTRDIDFGPASTGESTSKG